MSKGYSLAGLRFGFGIASKGLIDGLMKVKDSYNVDAVAIAAATAAITDQEYLKQTIEKVKAERSRLKAELEKLGFKVGQSQTNFILAVNKNAGQIFQKLVDKDIYVRYWNTDTLKDKLRITVGTKEQNDKLIEALKEILS
jgi:histidinol-phosphate aminotransferase